MFKKTITLTSLTTFAIIASTTSAYAEDVNQKLERLEKEIRALKEESKKQKEEVKQVKQIKTEKATSVAGSVEYGKSGFKVKSADGNAEFGIRGQAQLDSRTFLNDDGNTGRDEIIARRLRPIFTAKIDDFSFKFMPDFAGGTTRVFDAHADYKFSDPIQLRVGKFKAPIGLERLQSSQDLTFIERGLTSNLAPSRDFGVQLYGDIEKGLVEYQVGLFNGTTDNGNVDNDADDDKDIVARIFSHPFAQAGIDVLKKFGIGIAGSVGDRNGTASNTILGDYRSIGQQRIFAYRTATAAADTTFASGEQWRLNPETYYYYGPIGFLGEYSVSNQDVSRGTASENLEHKAWNAQISYVLTGENATFKGNVKPDETFDPANGKWGAFEVAARVGGIEFDDDAFPIFASADSSVRDADTFGIGLNWYFNERVKAQINYDHTEFSGGAAAGGDRPDEEALLTRIQYLF